MTSSSNNNWTSLLMPFALLVIASALLVYLEQLPANIIGALAATPYLVGGVTIVFGITYGKHRSVLQSITILACYSILDFFGHLPEPLSSAEFNALAAIMALITAICIAIITTLPDRRLINLQGIVALGSIALLFILGVWLYQSHAGMLSVILLANISNQIILPELIQLSQPLIIIYALCLAVVLQFAIKQPSVFNVAFLAGLIATALAFNANPLSAEGLIFICTFTIMQASALVQNSYFIAYIDELTGLPGRRALNEELAKLNGLYSIAMLDIDHFKQFNDTYGHDIGDQVLRMVASKISDVGGGAKFYRYGGEEFSIVFPGKTSREAFPFLSTLRETVEETHMILRAKDRPSEKPDELPKPSEPQTKLHVTISIGVAEHSDQLPSPDDVIKAADQALYKAKEKGRNRISQHGMELGNIPTPSLES